jgi:hypothetical protein
LLLYISMFDQAKSQTAFFRLFPPRSLHGYTNGADTARYKLEEGLRAKMHSHRSELRMRHI